MTFEILTQNVWFSFAFFDKDIAGVKLILICVQYFNMEQRTLTLISKQDPKSSLNINIKKTQKTTKFNLALKILNGHFYFRHTP